MNDQWQDNLRNRMELHEEVAPEGLWEEIDQRITADGMRGRFSRSHKIRVWGKRMGATAAVAAAAIVLLFIVRNDSMEDQTDEPFTGNVTPTKPQQKPELLLAGNRNEAIAVKESENFVTQVDEKDHNLELIEEQEAIANDPEVTHPEAESMIANDPDPEPGGNEFIRDSSHPALDAGDGHDQLLAMNGRRDHQNPTKWQTGLSLSNASSGSSESYSGYGTFAVTETVEEQYHFLVNDTREQSYTDVRHHQPITFGLTLRYNLNERWSVASGLTYSLLSSELRSGSGNYYYDDRQTLHFIGVPVQFAYTFWQNPKISAYLSTGGLVEKNVAGRLSSYYYIDNQLETTAREKISMNQLQWSVNAAIGLGYRISNPVGLYAEPGFSWYFPNGSELETIYNDNPLIFNLTIGLRYTWGE